MHHCRRENRLINLLKKDKLVDMAKVYKKYQEFQRARAIIDFDDMVVEAVGLLRKRTDAAKKYQNKFKQILVWQRYCGRG